MTRRRLSVALVVLVLLGGCSPAEAPDTATTPETADSGLIDAQFDAALLKVRMENAEEGDARAQASLGRMYRNGQGVPQDYEEAAKWYRLAADQGLAPAQHGLGDMYFSGQAVPQDYVEAAKWYRLAAEQGYVLGQNNLGVIYSHGQGVLQDYVEAYKWANLAASRATGDYREQFTEFRDDLAKLMTRAQLAEAQQLAKEWQAAFDARQE